MSYNACQLQFDWRWLSSSKSEKWDGTGELLRLFRNIFNLAVNSCDACTYYHLWSLFLSSVEFCVHAVKILSFYFYFYRALFIVL